MTLHEILDRDSMPTRLPSRAALSVIAVPASTVVAAALAAARAASAPLLRVLLVFVWVGLGLVVFHWVGWKVGLFGCPMWRHARTVNSLRRRHHAVPIRVLTRPH